jgi:HD-GYP domain-containing protein (c-di-GMP phosphodiesterase class II)
VPTDTAFASGLLSTPPDFRNPVVPDPCTNSRQAAFHLVRSKGHPIGVLIAGRKVGKDQEISSYDLQLLEATAGLLSSFCENVVLYDDQRQMFLGTVRALSAAIDAKDQYTCGHSERVAYLCGQIGLALNLSGTEVELARLAGLVHDVGKIGVPEAVLTKPGKLTDAEFDVIKQHPEIGHRILGGIPPLSAILPAVLHHHERFDGRGYPSGLAGTDIPLLARIVSVADTFDAMSSNRSYRPALPRARVLAEMVASGGKQLDADIVGAFSTGRLTLFRCAAEGGAVHLPVTQQRQTRRHSLYR